MKWFFKHYAADPKNPYALPIKADSLKHLPSATIITAEIDPLLSDGMSKVRLALKNMKNLNIEGLNLFNIEKI